MAAAAAAAATTNCLSELLSKTVGRSSSSSSSRALTHSLTDSLTQTLFFTVHSRLLLCRRFSRRPDAELIKCVQRRPRRGALIVKGRRRMAQTESDFLPPFLFFLPRLYLPCLPATVVYQSSENSGRNPVLCVCCLTMTSGEKRIEKKGKKSHIRARDRELAAIIIPPNTSSNNSSSGNR